MTNTLKLLKEQCAGKTWTLDLLEESRGLQRVLNRLAFAH
jgi:hypothetical protein